MDGDPEQKVCLEHVPWTPSNQRTHRPWLAQQHGDGRLKSKHLSVAVIDCRYELFIDDLPVWGFVGPPPEETKDDENIYIYTHKAFDVNYNENRVRSKASSGMCRGRLASWTIWQSCSKCCAEVVRYKLAPCEHWIESRPVIMAWGVQDTRC